MFDRLRISTLIQSHMDSIDPLLQAEEVLCSLQSHPDGAPLAGRRDALRRSDPDNIQPPHAGANEDLDWIPYGDGGALRDAGVEHSAIFFLESRSPRRPHVMHQRVSLGIDAQDRRIDAAVAVIER